VVRARALTCPLGSQRCGGNLLPRLKAVPHFLAVDRGRKQVTLGAEEFFRRVPVPPALHEDIKHIAIFSARRSPPESRYGDSSNIGLYKVPALVQERFTSAF
jgi:hypothetical protein